MRKPSSTATFLHYIPTPSFPLFASVVFTTSIQPLKAVQHSP